MAIHDRCVKFLLENLGTFAILSLDLLVTFLLLLPVQPEPPRYAAGFVVSRHYDFLWKPPGYPMERPCFSVTVETTSGERVRLRCQESLVWVLHWGDYYQGEIMDD